MEDPFSRRAARPPVGSWLLRVLRRWHTPGPRTPLGTEPQGQQLSRMVNHVVGLTRKWVTDLSVEHKIAIEVYNTHTHVYIYIIHI